MAERQIDPALMMAFAEITSIKLVLAAIMKGILPEDVTEGRAEVDAMIKQAKMLAFRGLVGGMSREDSEKMMKVAQEQAVAFLEMVKPKLPKPKN